MYPWLASVVMAEILRSIALEKILYSEEGLYTVIFNLKAQKSLYFYLLLRL